MNIEKYLPYHPDPTVIKQQKRITEALIISTENDIGQIQCQLL